MHLNPWLLAGLAAYLTVIALGISFCVGGSCR